MTLRYVQRLFSILQEMSGKIDSALLSVTNVLNSVILSDAVALYRRMQLTKTLRYVQRLFSIYQEMSGKINAVLLSASNALNSVILSSPLGEEQRMSSHNMKFTKLSLLFLIFFLSLPLFAENSEYQPEKFQGEEQIKYVIKHYYTERYEGIKKLEQQDFSYQIADWIPETREWAQEEQDLRELELYVAKLYHLNYLQYDFQLDFISFRYLLDGQKAFVTLKEAHQVVFKAISPVVSELANRKHMISLRLKDGIWRISYVQYDNEYAQMLKDFSKEEIIRRIDKNYNEGQKERKPKSQPGRFANEETFYPYNREKAVEYANFYWKNYNHSFDDFENNNCTNYVSQILLSGGAPMDSDGGFQWFYEKPDKPGETYSFSWTVVQDLYYYLVHNYWTGPVGRRTTLCEMESGDVIQFYSPTKGWLHSIVVVEILKTEENCGNRLNYLVNSHTTDRYHYPLAYFGGHYKRYIHIEGWFE